jgi:protein gp37
MAKDSRIEWTHHTFNPWWGCVKVSPACANCYAETWAHRLGASLWGRAATRRFFNNEHWRHPVKWNAAAERAQVRRRVFCASMADVFEVRAELNPWRTRLWPLIEQTPWLDWLLLTKRPQNVRRMVPWDDHWPGNIWLGTTAENQKHANLRIPRLLEVPARIHFVSAEPLLGPLSIATWRGIDWVIAEPTTGACEPRWRSDALWPWEIRGRKDAGRAHLGPVSGITPAPCAKYPSRPVPRPNRGARAT